MLEIYANAARCGGRGEDCFDEDRIEYAHDLKLIDETFGYEIYFSPSRKRFYIDLPEDIGKAGVLVFDEKDLLKWLEIIKNEDSWEKYLLPRDYLKSS